MRPSAVRAALIALLALASAAVIGLLLTGGAAPRIARSYVDASGWSVAYPGGFDLESSGNLAFEHEFTISNFAASPGVLTRTYPGGGNVREVPPVDSAGRFPAAGVAVRVEDNIQPPMFRAGSRQLPIGIGEFRPSGGLGKLRYNAATGETSVAARDEDEPASRVLALHEGNAEFTIVLWIGAKARPAATAQIAGAISSLAFKAPLSDPFAS